MIMLETTQQWKGNDKRAVSNVSVRHDIEHFLFSFSLNVFAHLQFKQAWCRHMATTHGICNTTTAHEAQLSF